MFNDNVGKVPTLVIRSTSKSGRNYIQTIVYDKKGLAVAKQQQKALQPYYKNPIELVFDDASYDLNWNKPFVDQ